MNHLTVIADNNEKTIKQVYHYVWFTLIIIFVDYFDAFVVQILFFAEDILRNW